MHLPCSPTPVGSTPPGPGGDADAALATSTAKAPARKLSRLNHTAFALAVYASPSLLPLPTQDSLRLPARLYRTGFEPAGSAERFLTVSYISSPFLKLGLLCRPSWREEVLFDPTLAIVPLDLWRAARRKLAEARRKSPLTGRRKSRNQRYATTLLSGTLICEYCGNELTLCRLKGKYKQMFYLNGPTGAHGWPSCRHRGAPPRRSSI